MDAFALTDQPDSGRFQADRAHALEARLCRVELVAHLPMVAAGQLELGEALELVNVTLEDVADVRIVGLISDDPDLIVGLGLRNPTRGDAAIAALWRSQLEGGATRLSPVERSGHVLVPGVHDRLLLGAGRVRRNEPQAGDAFLSAIGRGLGEGMHRAVLLSRRRWGCQA